MSSATATTKTKETLIGLIRSDQKDCTLKFGFYLVLNASGIHSGPAICEMEAGKKREVVYMDDLSVLEELWNLLPREHSKIIPVLFFGNAKDNNWFVVSDGVLMGDDIKTAEPFQFLSREKFEELKQRKVRFEWGLVTTASGPSEENWSKYITEAIEKVRHEYV